MNKAIIKLQGSQQRRRINHAQHSIQDMLAQAHLITKKTSSLPPISPAQPYTDSHLTLSPIQLNSILQQPALQYRRISRGRHFCPTSRGRNGRHSLEKIRKSQTITIPGEESIKRIASKVEKELLGKANHFYSVELSEKKRRLQIKPAQMPKYYLTISDRGIECGRRLFQRQDSTKQEEKFHQTKQQAISTNKETIEKDDLTVEPTNLPSIIANKRQPLRKRQRIRSVLLRSHKRELQEEEELSQRYQKECRQKKEPKREWEPWQTQQNDQQQLLFNQISDIRNQV